MSGTTTGSCTCNSGYVYNLKPIDTTYQRIYSECLPCYTSCNTCYDTTAASNKCLTCKLAYPYMTYVSGLTYGTCTTACSGN